MADQHKDDMSMNEILKSIKNFVSVGDRTEPERPLQAQKQAEAMHIARGTEPSYKRAENLPATASILQHNREEKDTGTQVEESLPSRRSEESLFLSTAEKMHYADEVDMPEFMQQPLKTSRPSFQESKIYEGGPLPPRSQERPHFTVSNTYSTAVPNTREERLRSVSRNQASPSHPQFSSANASSGRPNIKATFQNFANTVEKLASPKPASLQPSTFQTGLDAMMLEAIQKAVSTWIDQHMQAIVEDIVQHEVEKITQEILTKR